MLLFGVNTVGQYRDLLDNTEDRLQHSGLYRVPPLKDGLMYDSAGSLE